MVESEDDADVGDDEPSKKASSPPDIVNSGGAEPVPGAFTSFYTPFLHAYQFLSFRRLCSYPLFSAFLLTRTPPTPLTPAFTEGLNPINTTTGETLSPGSSPTTTTTSSPAYPSPPSSFSSYNEKVASVPTTPPPSTTASESLFAEAISISPVKCHRPTCTPSRTPFCALQKPGTSGTIGLTWVEGTREWRVDGVLSEKVKLWREEERREREEQERRRMGTRWSDDSMDIDQDVDEELCEESEDFDENDSEEIKELKVRRKYLRNLLQSAGKSSASSSRRVPRSSKSEDTGRSLLPIQPWVPLSSSPAHAPTLSSLSIPVPIPHSTRISTNTNPNFTTTATQPLPQ
ncbi:hypothetical protein K435DRAFT_355332 [Dendrothele bispora CBS 962.96]|uniref:Uncharacterized protein n=1 Tax=Dendrothele bispora (strain CBS 962.96) TaxID=1314807 RepID=A0A4S8LF71_DENBC|nr:hypothetical protein K435DRAFT_355332 [Dendrothele bispora CBS 962.96]